MTEPKPEAFAYVIAELRKVMPECLYYYPMLDRLDAAHAAEIAEMAAALEREKKNHALTAGQLRDLISACERLKS